MSIVYSNIDDICKGILSSDRVHEFSVAYREYLADERLVKFWREMERVSGKDTTMVSADAYSPNDLLYKLIDSCRERPEFHQLRPLHHATMEKYRIRTLP
jgi:hypothetical protein